MSPFLCSENCHRLENNPVYFFFLICRRDCWRHLSDDKERVLVFDSRKESSSRDVFNIPFHPRLDKNRQNKPSIQSRHGERVSIWSLGVCTGFQLSAPPPFPSILLRALKCQWAVKCSIIPFQRWLEPPLSKCYICKASTCRHKVTMDIFHPVICDTVQLPFFFSLCKPQVGSWCDAFWRTPWCLQVSIERDLGCHKLNQPVDCFKKKRRGD